MVKTHVRISANFDRTLDGVKAFLEEAEAGLTFPAFWTPCSIGSSPTCKGIRVWGGISLPAQPVALRAV